VPQVRQQSGDYNSQYTKFSSSTPPRIMANPKTTKTRDGSGKIASRSTQTTLPMKGAKPAAPVKSHAVRETVESIVIAFVLAFLFRTFEAEAFVIPTGSMAPTLMGRHKDVYCPKCGYRYQVSASEEESEDPRRPTANCVAGMCPMCHYVLPMRADLPDGVPEKHEGKIDMQPSYNGDRILVNKYLYTFAEPHRWDVVVFKFPGDAKVNYIKRLVGLPGENLRIYQGDVFVAKKANPVDSDYEIIHKPADKILAMRQLVHDTNFDPAELDAAGWPVRWHSQPEGSAAAWAVEKTASGKDVRQTYSVDASKDDVSWLRYENLTPTYKVWQDVKQQNDRGDAKPLFSDADRAQFRRLVMDANPYDARVVQTPFANSLAVDPKRQGLHWVGDLMLEADVEPQSASGELLLDLVKGGRHFTCHIDLANGDAKLAIDTDPTFAPKAKTSVIGTAKHRLAFSNIDDQLLLWVDGSVVSFDSETTYDVTRVFGTRESIRPRTSSRDLGDFAPAGVGGRGAKLAVNRLRVWRDLYYIADDYQRSFENVVTDFNHPFDDRLEDLATTPSLWPRFSERNKAEFPINDQQLFVMGDNSAESSDARLWKRDSGHGSPGGAYLERRLLIGKALCVYWPHSWNRIPGTPIPFPRFPNIADMRLVR
jgi:signal peptidase I